MLRIIEPKPIRDACAALCIVIAVSFPGGVAEVSVRPDGSFEIRPQIALPPERYESTVNVEGRSFEFDQTLLNLSTATATEQA